MVHLRLENLKALMEVSGSSVHSELSVRLGGISALGMGSAGTWSWQGMRGFVLKSQEDLVWVQP